MQQSETIIESLKMQIYDLSKSISSLDIYTDEVTPYLKQVSEIFNMDINFDKEWAEFLGVESVEEIQDNLEKFKENIETRITDDELNELLCVE